MTAYLAVSAGLQAEVFSAQSVPSPAQNAAGDWDHNPGTETWNQPGKRPGKGDEVWIDSGCNVRIFNGWHSISKLEMRSSGGRATLEVAGGGLNVTGIAKFEGSGNSIIVSGGTLNIYWAYGGIDGLRITGGSFEVQGQNWDTIHKLSQSGGIVILHSLDISQQGGYIFESGSTGVLKVQTNTPPKEFYSNYVGGKIAKPAGSQWVYGTQTINGTTYATLSIR